MKYLIEKHTVRIFTYAWFLYIAASVLLSIYL